MAAKETHCFHFWAGRVIPYATVALGIVLVFHTPPWLQGVFWWGLTALWAMLVWARWQLPLFEVKP
jgi:membrane protein implicated in regulation of membrane protease activity